MPSELKTCQRCGHSKPIADFYKCRDRKEGTRAWCKSCDAEYARMSRAERKQRNFVAQSRRCIQCKEEKPACDFYRAKSSSKGLSSICKQCTRDYVRANQDRIKEYHRAYRRENAEQLQRSRYLRKIEREYGLSEADVKVLLERQCSVCAICAQKPKHFCIDHDHATGKVRGLLCPACNRGLGILGDTVEGLMKAVAYLQQHEEREST